MLDRLRIDTAFLRELPVDETEGGAPRQVFGACASRVKPTIVRNPQLAAFSREAAALIGLTEADAQTNTFLDVFVGNDLLAGMDPYACCYGGHQFGNWAGQLGDGRAINLGDVMNDDGTRWTLQLKGAGPTPYSRTADGLAVLRSSVREFLCSEAMHHLGVPTTRALSLALTGEQVLRDMFYDGNPAYEPGAVVCRMAPSFTRFGNFQIFRSRGEHDVLKQFVDYTIKTDFPELGAPSVDVYVAWFEEICRRTAVMVAHWMRVGFVHGVMNTDNMSILGLTIDYGPYGWLEDFDPNWTPNTTDAGMRRYCFGQQPQIAMWNLAQLAQAILPLVEDVETLQRGLDHYLDEFEKNWQSMTAKKLGLAQYREDTDATLIADLLVVLRSHETDMTLFYRCLASPEMGELLAGDCDDDTLLAPLMEAFYLPETMGNKAKIDFINWLLVYRSRLNDQGEPEDTRRDRMNAVNPLYVMRNYLAQLAIDKAAEGDFSQLNEQLDVLRNPYVEQPGKETFAAKRPEWARNRPGCSMLSCSS